MSVFGEESNFKREQTSFERPLDVYEALSEEHGFLFQRGENSLTVCGKLKAGTIKSGVTSAASL